MSGFYSTPQWIRLRKMVLSSTPMCEARGCAAMATDVDHIDGDATHNDRDNLQALCHECHSAKTARENREINPSDKPLKGHDASGMPIDAGHPWG